tara:strand:- start:99 stop:1226 length:1128 start_codon:yes stop_codon:yes gene_type:complete
MIKKNAFYLLFLIVNIIFTQNCDDGFSYYPNASEDYNITVQDDGACFNDGDLEALTDIIIQNDFDEGTMVAFELGTQTWNDGRLRFLVAGYYFGGVDIPIHTIPESINKLDDLRKLYLEWNHITVLPDTFSELTALVQLYISNNQLTNLPNNFGDLDNLFILDLGYNLISSLPDSMVDLNNVTYLWLFNNQLTSLPEGFCNLDLEWDGDDYFGYPYFAIGGNNLCNNVPECVANSDHLNTSLEQYYYSVQITECQDCECGDGICNGCEDEESCVDDCLLNANEYMNDIPFEINHVYPNPFNPITNIEFSIANSDIISISIFDLNGKMISQIMHKEFVSAGSYKVEWDATAYSSGVYFINITNGKINKNRKIILQK